MPLDTAHGAEASGLLPDADDATKLAVELHEGSEQDEVDGVLLPHFTKKPHDALGICAHWQSATQDVDFERKLLLRALLEALPPGAVVLPEGAGSIAELEMAPFKVQAILEAVRARKRVNLNSPAFRWDVKQPPPKLSWGEMGEDPAAGSSLAWGGMSKRQLEIASFETLLLSLDQRGVAEADMLAGGGTKERAAALRAIAKQLGIGAKIHRKLQEALLHERVAVCPSPMERCGLKRRLELLRETTPFDFETDNDFFEWQARQAAVLGASLHTLLAAVAAEFPDPEVSPAAMMHALVDALFMELLATARPTPPTVELRRSRGFPEQAHRYIPLHTVT